MEASRKKVNLRELSPAIRYLIAITIVIIVFLLAWLQGKDQPIPNWIENGLIPILGWVFIGVMLLVTYRWIKARRSK